MIGLQLKTYYKTTTIMKKTDLKLLGLMYPDTVELISELIENSKNPEVALELVVGVYVSPIIPAKVIKDKTELFCLDFDKWEDKVHYYYTENKRVNKYFPKSVDKDTITKDNYLELCCSWSDECYSHWITLDEIVVKNDYMDLARWMKFSEADV